MSAIKVAILQPTEGPPETTLVHLGPQLAMRKLGNVLNMADKWGTITGNVDVVRARDRLARIFLHLTDATHALWWDSDVLPDDLQVVNRMLESGHDCVGAPYRRKTETEKYPYRLLGQDGEVRSVDVVNGCVDVDWLPFGFMLTSRACLQRMWDAYHADRWYIDYSAEAQEHHETVGMFDLLYTDVVPGPDGQPWRTKLSEDYSFCRSWQAIGGQVYMYVGEGAPVGHIGACVYRGTREGIVKCL